MINNKSSKIFNIESNFKSVDIRYSQDPHRLAGSILWLWGCRRPGPPRYKQPPQSHSWSKWWGPPAGGSFGLGWWCSSSDSPLVIQTDSTWAAWWEQCETREKHQPRDFWDSKIGVLAERTLLAPMGREADEGQCTLEDEVLLRAAWLC